VQGFRVQVWGLGVCKPEQKPLNRWRKLCESDKRKNVRVIKKKRKRAKPFNRWRKTCERNKEKIDAPCQPLPKAVGKAYVIFLVFITLTCFKPLLHQATRGRYRFYFFTCYPPLLKICCTYDVK
jgi:hypothetical protein